MGPGSVGKNAEIVSGICPGRGKGAARYLPALGAKDISLLLLVLQVSCEGLPLPALFPDTVMLLSSLSVCVVVTPFSHLRAVVMACRLPSVRIALT